MILGILSSLYPAYLTSPIEAVEGRTVETVVKTGLPAFLELHNIGWLFILCLALFLGGMALALYPKLHSKVLLRKKTGSKQTGKRSRGCFETALP